MRRRWLTATLAALGQVGGGPGRALASELDLLRETGIRAGRRQRRDAVVANAWAQSARRTIYRDIWQQAADAIGVQLDPVAGDFLELSCGGRRTVVHFHLVALDSPVTMELALDKPVVHELLSRAGLPVTDHVAFEAGRPADAVGFLASPAGDRFVVKPAAGTSGGHGVTCGVETADDFQRARLRAWRWDDRLLLERQATGDEYRLLFLEGEVLDILRRRPPTVVGDGRATVGELMTLENERRAASGGRAGLSPLRVDLDCAFTLRRSGLSLKSVPASGQRVQVKSATNEAGASDTETVAQASVSPELVAEAAAAAAAVGATLAGVDLVTTDAGRSLRQTGGVILEVNTTPALHYHYLVADTRGGTAVAVPVLARLIDGHRGL